MIFQRVYTDNLHQQHLQGSLKQSTQSHPRTGETEVSKGGTQEYVFYQAPPLKIENHRLKVTYFE